MKLNNFTISTAVVAGGPVTFGEAREAREARMRSFWADPKNKTIYMIGKFLANAHDGKTLAAHLLAGVEFEMDSIQANGKILPLVAGFKLSMATMPTSWGCPVCKSAHGSGVHPSPKQSADLLAQSKWFYNPQTKQLFTISDSCWSEWVKGLGAVKQFIQIPATDAVQNKKAS